MMKVIAFLLFVGVVSCFTEGEYKETFASWLSEHKRMYTASEFQNRYNAFKANMDFVNQWNADPTHTHEVHLNKFADMTNEEYRNTYLGTKINGTERLAAAAGLFDASVNFQKSVGAPMGDVINWAARGAVTPPKDQGQCGSCWSFSTTGSVEALNQIFTGHLNSLSEQNLMDCSAGNNGCNGGSMDLAFKYIIANNGIDLESAYPYEGKQGPCRFKSSSTGAAMRSYTDVQSGNEGALQNAINIRPVSIAIDASRQSFQLYKTGIYHDNSCSSTSLDHGVLAIGYGSDNGDYYIVKNSWGTDWGLSGYIWMSRNAGNNCGIATAASYPGN